MSKKKERKRTQLLAYPNLLPFFESLTQQQLSEPSHFQALLEAQNNKEVLYVEGANFLTEHLKESQVYRTARDRLTPS